MMSRLPKFLQNPFKPKTSWLELLLVCFAWYIIVPHELAHYLAARALDLHPTFTVWAVRHDHRDMFSTMIVTFAPTLLGMVWIAFGVLLLTQWATAPIQSSISWLVIIQGSGIFFASGYDWYDAYKDVRGEYE